MKELIKDKFKAVGEYIKTFFKWALTATVTGLIGGGIGTLFSKCIKYAGDANGRYPYILAFLPLAGLLIVFLYRLLKVRHDPGTNCIIDSVRSKGHVPYALAPLIFVSTILTHLTGGSAGREGAALQLGGSLGRAVGHVFRFDESDMHIAVMCGMSGLFSSLFGTPIAAAFFALEVISVGVTYYSALVPCFGSAVVSYFLTVHLGVAPLRFAIDEFIPKFGLLSLVQSIGLAAACAVISIVFCVAMKKTHKYANKLFKNAYLRIAVGGAAVVALTLLVGCRDYNGAGGQIIAAAITQGSAKKAAFLLKIIFTCFTIGFGYKGGEIVPTLFIGATFGCVFAGLIGLSPSFGAALGMICLFCGVVNCPVASIILSVEIFGAKGFALFAVGCAVSYMLSGYYGLYSSQKILYSKLKAEYINVNAK